MPQERHVEEVRSLIGKKYRAEDVPSYPGRIYWYDGEFLTEFPHAPQKIAEVRFEKAPPAKLEDFRIYEARAIDATNPEDSHGEWLSEE